MAATAISGCKRNPDCTCIWTIENAYSIHIFRSASSIPFHAKFIENTKWSLRLDKDFLINKKLLIFLIREDDLKPENIEIEFELSILGLDGLPLVTKKSKAEFKLKTCHFFDFSLNINEVVSTRREKYLAINELTVRCRIWKLEGQVSKSAMCFVRTIMEVDRHSFIWDISEFSKWKTEKKNMRFLYPISSGQPNVSLTLFLSERNGKNYINIEVGQKSTMKRSIILGEVSILDCDGKVVHSDEKWHLIPPSPEKSSIFVEFFAKEEIENDRTLLPNDVLYLKCIFFIFGDPTYCEKPLNLEDLRNISTENPELCLSQPNDSLASCCRFQKAFADLYGNESLSDVRIRIGPTSFHAHKNILSIRSPVFEAMFTQDMKEKSSRIVDILDMNANTMEHLLLYIYKDIVPGLQWEWECAMDLFRAADKYQLLDLREKCSGILNSNLCAANVCQILSLADMHNDGDLKNSAENFISEHDNDIFNSDEWKSFKEKNFRLVIEIMERMVMKRRK